METFSVSQQRQCLRHWLDYGNRTFNQIGGHGGYYSGGGWAARCLDYMLKRLPEEPRKPLKVNPTTLLFENIAERDREALIEFARSIAMEGKVPPRENYYINLWMEAAGFTNEQYLLVISTVFPARALLSVHLNYRELE